MSYDGGIDNFNRIYLEETAEAYGRNSKEYQEAVNLISKQARQRNRIEGASGKPATPNLISKFLAGRRKTHTDNRG